MCEWCSSGWRFDAVELGGPNGGRVKAVLHPISAEWENAYSRPSTGSLVLAVRDPSAEDIWAGTTGVYISQVLPDGTRLCRFGGEGIKSNGVGGGGLTIALTSIETFLNDRVIAGPNDPYMVVAHIPPPEFPDDGTSTFSIWKPNTPTFDIAVYTTTETAGGTSALAALLVKIAQGNLEGGPIMGLPGLTASYLPPYSPVVPTVLGTDIVLYNWWDFKNIGQAIKELVEAEDGIRYRLDHTYANGYWSTNMVFSDRIGTARDYTILSDREAWKYGLEVDAENKATRVYGVGKGDAGDVVYSIAYDADILNNLPERQTSVAWKDAEGDILDALTRGYVVDHRDPVTTPSVTIVGLPMYDPDAPDYDPQQGFPGPEILEPGDTFGIEIGYGAITVKDLQVRATAVAWQLEPDMTAQRTVAMQPIVRANDSIRTQKSASVDALPGGSAPAGSSAASLAPSGAVTQTVKPPPKVDPWPSAGRVCTVQDLRLKELSAMEVSSTSGTVWAMPDEQVSPQVFMVSKTTGNTVGTFTPVPGASTSNVGDPECMRLARPSGRLVLGDTGDNDHDRPTSGAGQPHLLMLPEPKGGGNKGNLPATRLPIAYPGGEKINVETLLIHPTTEEVLLVSKEDTRARVFTYGTLSSMSTSNNVGTLVATINDINNVSDGAHLLAGGFVAFRSVTATATFVYKDSTWTRAGAIPTPPMAKGEAICVESRCSFLTSTEGEHQPIYRTLIPTSFGATCGTTSGDSGTPGTPPPPPPSGATVPGQLLDLTSWKLTLPI